MTCTAEKLVYLQNGVFKRKEMATGLQYYHNGAFKTFALPSGNGSFVFSNYNNELTGPDYFIFKNEVNTELPTTSVLTPTVVYQDILGCTSMEHCLVYNDGTSVSKLAILKRTDRTC